MPVDDCGIPELIDDLNLSWLAADENQRLTYYGHLVWVRGVAPLLKLIAGPGQPLSGWAWSDVQLELAYRKPRVSDNLLGLALDGNARPNTLVYRGRKFVRRNRVAVVAAAFVLVSLIGGIVATAWQAHRAKLQETIARAEQRRAERRFQEVRKLGTFRSFRLSRRHQEPTRRYSGA